MRNVLVGAEVACTLLLLVVTALVVSSFAKMLTQQRDFDSDHVTLAQVNLFNANYGQTNPNSEAAKIAFIDRTLESLAQDSRGDSAAVTSEMPMARRSRGSIR